MQEQFRKSFRIRDYRSGDFGGIEELWRQTDLGNSNRGDNDSIIENSISMGGKLLILEELGSGKICGTSWMTFDGRRIHLHHFGILPEFQGKELSKYLLRESLKFVKEKGYQVKLEVHQDNHKAVSLYKKAGFKYLGDYNVYIIRDLCSMNPDQIFGKD